MMIIHMDFMIFKTNINPTEVDVVRTSLDRIPFIREWTIDVNDVDRVLRVKTSGNFDEEDVMKLLNTCGFHCEELPD